MKFIKPTIFPKNIEVVTVTKEMGDVSYNHEDHDYILQNRLHIAQSLGLPLNSMIAMNQVHSCTYQQVTTIDAGKGMFKKDDAIFETDAIYTFDQSLGLWSFHADCTPVVIYASDLDIIVNIHAGWLGTTKQIVQKTMQHLIDTYHIDPTRTYAYIGPCISKDQFQVQYDVIQKIQAMSFDTTKFYKKQDDIHYLVDNKGLNKQQLLECGVLDKNIEVSPYCTIKNNDQLFSHRCKEGGRSCTIVYRK